MKIFGYRPLSKYDVGVNLINIIEYYQVCLKNTNGVMNKKAKVSYDTFVKNIKKEVK